MVNAGEQNALPPAWRGPGKPARLREGGRQPRVRLRRAVPSRALGV